MANGSTDKTVLSKNVLQMKFMQRSVLRIEKEKHEEETKREIDEEHWVLDLPITEKLKSKYIFEPSIVRIEELRYGRMSFNECNPEVEKLMKMFNKEQELEVAEEREKETSVNDEEMANRYQSLFGTIAKKFSKKRSREKLDEDEGELQDQVPSNKRKFLKPSDD